MFLLLSCNLTRSCCDDQAARRAQVERELKTRSEHVAEDFTKQMQVGNRQGCRLPEQWTAFLMGTRFDRVLVFCDTISYDPKYCFGVPILGLDAEGRKRAAQS